eukprot:CAMPEP_0185737170 /NCGR_PEP_ID=MMETSP1171-20130828/29836_1 /TAXON_ID=374046 /ORGANISM="Helicotheca tamensis, Strain CCMP826" /LENGTH=221 /DNA_ID=CAMNT_0028408033 /DNA_START=32 /DNA_END=694 /DNA_ORIENTATION=+
MAVHPSSQQSLLFCICLALLGHNANAFQPTPPQPSLHIRTKTTIPPHILSFSNNDNANSDEDTVSSRREAIMKGIATASIMMTTVGTPVVGNAFENKISDKYDDRPKRRGPQPKDLGVSTRKDMIGEPYTGLKPCGPAPNCFCTTDAIEDDPEHNIPPWSYPKSYTKTEAFQEIADVIGKYKPGQGNIDGGGFKVMKLDVEGGYMYTQFESLKNGYIDDVE